MADRFTIRCLILKLSLPLVYAGFFLVQFSLSFDTNGTPFSTRNASLENRNQPGRPVSFQKAKDRLPLKPKFRLNKRFQPTDMPALPGINDAVILHFIDIQPVSWINPFITYPLHNAHLLRGPPYIA
jgi:hypothetical protein